jgi:hypothetical protein
VFRNRVCIRVVFHGAHLVRAELEFGEEQYTLADVTRDEIMMAGTPATVSRNGDADTDTEKSKPGLLARTYASMDIDLHTFLRMLKFVTA